MTKFQIGGAALGLVVLMTASGASAGIVEGACMKSDRSAANRALCSCIQKVADVTLSGSDQRMVAGFFTDPNKAEKVRMQSSASANAFWDRYTVFGQQAEMACQG